MRFYDADAPQIEHYENYEGWRYDYYDWLLLHKPTWWQRVLRWLHLLERKSLRR